MRILGERKCELVFWRQRFKHLDCTGYARTRVEVEDFDRIFTLKALRQRRNFGDLVAVPAQIRPYERAVPIDTLEIDLTFSRPVEDHAGATAEFGGRLEHRARRGRRQQLAEVRCPVT